MILLNYFYLLRKSLYLFTSWFCVKTRHTWDKNGTRSIFTTPNKIINGVKLGIKKFPIFPMYYLMNFYANYTWTVNKLLVT